VLTLTNATPVPVPTVSLSILGGTLAMMMAHMTLPVSPDVTALVKNRLISVMGSVPTSTKVTVPMSANQSTTTTRENGNSATMAMLVNTTPTVLLLLNVHLNPETSAVSHQTVVPFASLMTALTPELLSFPAM
jgi:hypothetical protein